jgi:hypothetical protein
MLQKFLLALLVIPILAMGLEAFAVVASGYVSPGGLFIATLMGAPSLILLWWAIAHAREQRQAPTNNSEKTSNAQD